MCSAMWRDLAIPRWLLYSDRLCDKRELAHYSQPRILVQQIFWQRMSAFMQEPTAPYLYLNTLFAVYDADNHLIQIKLRGPARGSHA